MNEQDLTGLKNIVRIGTVSSVDVGSRTARVAFADKQDTEGKPLISGPLKVIQSPPFIPGKDATQETQSRSGEDGTSAYVENTRAVVVYPWLPYVGQFVLCIYLPNGESDGFVIGGI